MTYDDLDDGVPNLDDCSDSDLEAARLFFQTAHVSVLAMRLKVSYDEARRVGDILFI